MIADPLAGQGHAGGGLRPRTGNAPEGEQIEQSLARGLVQAIAPLSTPPAHRLRFQVGGQVFGNTGAAVAHHQHISPSPR